MRNHTIDTDVAIVGAGPIGIELAIALEELGVKYVLLEAKQIGQAISKWPPNTHFYSTPEHVALAGVPVHNLDQQPITGEQYLAYLRTLVEMNDLNLRVYEPVVGIQQEQDGFKVSTLPLKGPRSYNAQYVVLATGGMARPRMLNIPGENLPNVTHYFPGPHPYFRTRVLVVGGRNSAIESALRCWRGGAAVTISYRRTDFDFEMIKPHLAMDLKDRFQKGEINFLPMTIPVEISPTHVLLASTENDLKTNGSSLAHETDFVLLCTGFEADMELFRIAGVELLGEAQVPRHDQSSMETNIKRLFVAGTAAGGTQSRFTYFISTSHDHVAKIVKAITGKVPNQLGTVTARNNAVTWDEVKAN
ncbi:MAG: NAD(P)-binding domain-containing protein [Candidatus Promineifilaceae bacterium]|nr:NAD(P)-binding domain-containing protein [Candidatus Promineifilaceae bacterium]